MPQIETSFDTNIDDASEILGRESGLHRNLTPRQLSMIAIGGAIGTAAEASARQSQTVTVTDQRALAQIQHKATNYRRALSACLDARGYSVR